MICMAAWVGVGDLGSLSNLGDSVVLWFSMRFLYEQQSQPSPFTFCIYRTLLRTHCTPCEVLWTPGCSRRMAEQIICNPLRKEWCLEPWICTALPPPLVLPFQKRHTCGMKTTTARTKALAGLLMELSLWASLLLSKTPSVFSKSTFYPHFMIQPWQN